jgi:hypothetical protein
MDDDKRFIKFKPKKNHAGEYMIYVTKIFNSTNLNFELKTTVKLTVLERQPLPPPPGTLGERVRFRIEKISKKGAVTVKVKPKLTNMLLT